MNEIIIKALIVLVLCLCFSCTELTYKDEICYNYCNDKGLNIDHESEKDCVCK